MTRYHAELAAAERHAAVRRDAQAAGQELLEQTLREREGG
jgi:hypothetical protein